MAVIQKKNNCISHRKFLGAFAAKRVYTARKWRYEENVTNNGIFVETPAALSRSSFLSLQEKRIKFQLSLESGSVTLPHSRGFVKASHLLIFVKNSLILCSFFFSSMYRRRSRELPVNSQNGRNVDRSETARHRT